MWHFFFSFGSNTISLRSVTGSCVSPLQSKLFSCACQIRKCTGPNLFKLNADWVLILFLLKTEKRGYPNMGHFISRKKTFLFKVTLAAALPILFVAEPTYAAGISSSHIETKTETKERIKKREKKAKRNRVIKIKDQDYFTESYPSSINTVTKEISKKTIKKKHLKKGKKKVRITIKTVTTVKTISDETQLNQKITTLSDMRKYLPKEIYNVSA